jgi:hypothetical protein
MRYRFLKIGRGIPRNKASALVPREVTNSGATALRAKLAQV